MINKKLFISLIFSALAFCSIAKADDIILNGGLGWDDVSTASGGGGGSTQPYVTDTSWAASGSLAGHFTVGGGSWTVRNSGVSTQASTFTYAATQTTGPGGLYITSAPASADGCAEAQMWVTSVTGPESNGPAIRAQTASNGDVVWLQWNSGAVGYDIFERASNNVTNIATFNTGTVKPSTQPGDWVALCGAGSSVKAYVNGVLIGTIATNVTANGKIGLFGYFNDTNTGGANYRINGFRGYNANPY